MGPQLTGWRIIQQITGILKRGFSPGASKKQEIQIGKKQYIMNKFNSRGQWTLPAKYLMMTYLPKAFKLFEIHKSCSLWNLS